MEHTRLSSKTLLVIIVMVMVFFSKMDMKLKIRSVSWLIYRERRIKLDYERFSKTQNSWSEILELWLSQDWFCLPKEWIRYARWPMMVSVLMMMMEILFLAIMMAKETVQTLFFWIIGSKPWIKISKRGQALVESWKAGEEVVVMVYQFSGWLMSQTISVEIMQVYF